MKQILSIKLKVRLLKRNNDKCEIKKRHYVRNKKITTNDLQENFHKTLLITENLDDIGYFLEKFKSTMLIQEMQKTE